MALRFSSETEQELLARAVDSLPRVTKFPVAFGGLTTDGLLPVTATAGTRTRSLAGLVVQPERGLGGRSLVEKRARLAIDYRTARGITHDYDRAVLGEGISTLFAVPVMVDGQAQGVLYCGSWAESAVGDVVARAAFSVAESLATELRVRSEIERRLSSFAAPAPTDISSAAREAARELRRNTQHRGRDFGRIGETSTPDHRAAASRLERRQISRHAGHTPFPSRSRCARQCRGGRDQRGSGGIPGAPRRNSQVLSAIGDVQTGCLYPPRGCDKGPPCRNSAVIRRPVAKERNSPREGLSPRRAAAFTIDSTYGTQNCSPTRR